MQSSFIILYLGVVLAAGLGESMCGQVGEDIVKRQISQDEIASFFLITTSNPAPRIAISPENSTEFLKRIFEPGSPTKIAIHGWQGNATNPMVSNITKAYVETRKVNAIGVDWSKLASDPLYANAAAAVLPVGARVAALINRLMEAKLATLDGIHLIGFSLGAHISGIASSLVTAGRVSRITGLDPPKLGFESTTPLQNRLDKTDANFVDIMHTSTLIGDHMPLGHADFYPNGGLSPMPGCTNFSSNWQLTVFCSHIRSFLYYIESIYNQSAFRSVKCDSYTSYMFGFCSLRPQEFMGDPTKNTTTGLYYLRTNSQPPYGQG